MIESILHIYIISWLMAALIVYRDDDDEESEFIVEVFRVPLVPFLLILVFCGATFEWLQDHREGVDLW